MDKIRIGVLTVRDNCEGNEESGPNLVQMIENGIIKNGTVTKMDQVRDRSEDIERKLSEWSNGGVNLILMIGGTEVTERDITAMEVWLRAVVGVQKKSLIINLPESKKQSQECLEAVASVIPYAIGMISAGNVRDSLGKKSSVSDRTTGYSYPNVTVEKAQTLTMERLYMFRKVTMLSYEKAHGYVLAEDLVAPYHLPLFHISLKDGYAVLSSDKTSERTVIEASNAKERSIILPGNCLRVSKGAAVPRYADAVIQVQEYQNKINLTRQPKKGQNIQPCGSDFKKWQLLLTSGTYLDSAAVEVVTAAGATSVEVFEKPKVAIISIRDELEDLKVGKVRDSNRIALINLLKEEDVQAEDLGIVPDEADALLNALERAFRVADVVVTTGSMSMGERDYLKEVLVSDFNAEISFGSVNMKPVEGTSLAFLVFEGKPKLCFGMLGNPNFPFVSSQLFLLPALRKISGNEKAFPVSVWAELDELPKLDFYPQYLKVKLTYDISSHRWRATLPGNQNGDIRNSVNANCVIELPDIFKLHTVQMRNLSDNSISYLNNGKPFHQSPPQTLRTPNWKFIVKAFLTRKILCAEMC